MTPISSDKRKKKRTWREITTSFVGSIIPMLIVAGITYYGTSQNTSGANGQKIVSMEQRINKFESECKEQKEKETGFKEDVGVMLNKMNNKLDTLLDGQDKQERFNKRIAKDNKDLTRSLEDIFGIRRSANNN
jgi:septal ring factor EnvC (AmiA/AmiB activator)